MRSPELYHRRSREGLRKIGKPWRKSWCTMAGTIVTSLGGNKMVALLRFDKLLPLLSLLGILLFANVGAGQESSTPLLRLQRSKAYLNLETNVGHAQGMYGIT